MDDKIIVTNRSALVLKYGSKGLAAIRKALTALAAADKKRGIKSRVLYLDDQASMKKLKGAAVMNAGPNPIRGARAAMKAAPDAPSPAAHP